MVLDNYAKVKYNKPEPWKAHWQGLSDGSLSKHV